MNANNDLPGNEDHHHNGNGNGNGNGKIFTLKPTISPETLAILDARNKALEEPKTVLNPGAKACFCAVLDRALDPNYYEKKGIVVLSDNYLAGKFTVSKRTIFTWKKAVETAGYFWTSKQWRSNMWPLTIYNITALHPKPTKGKTDPGGTYGSGKLKPLPRPALGARPDPNQPTLALKVARRRPPGGRKSAPGTEETTTLQGISADSREKLRVSAEENCGSQPKKTAGPSRRKLRLTAEENCGSQPKKTAADSRSELPAPAEANCELLETQNRGGVRETKEIRGGGEGTTTPREEKFLGKYPAPEWEAIDAGMFNSKREKFCEAGIALAKEQREAIANDPLSRHPGEPKFHTAAAAVSRLYKDRIDLLKKFATAQKVRA